jgi:hypothetical protein
MIANLVRTILIAPDTHSKYSEVEEHLVAGSSTTEDDSLLGYGDHDDYVGSMNL